MSDVKPLYEMNVVELMDMDSALMEYQLQEGLPPGLMVKKIKELAAKLFTAQADLRASVEDGAATRRRLEGQLEKKSEWWKTFRVVLTGLSATAAVSNVTDMVLKARECANLVHGTLEIIEG